MQHPIEFDENKHEYSWQGSKYIAVNDLLKKYNLTADYTGIPQHILEEAAKRGKAVHKMLEEYIKHGTIMDRAVLDPFISYCTNRKIDLTQAKSESVVFNDTYMVAGTVDFQYKDGNSEVIADFKTTSSIHYDSVIWQLSLYNYLVSQGDMMQYYFKEIKVFHINNGKFTVKDLPLVEFDEIEKLLNAYTLNLPYTYTPDYSKVLSNSEETVYTQLVNEIAEYSRILKQLEDKRKGLDRKIIDSMQNSKIHTMTLKELKVTLTERIGSKTLDSTKVKEYLKCRGENVDDFMKVGKGSVSLTVTPLKEKYIPTVDEDINNMHKDEESK